MNNRILFSPKISFVTYFFLLIGTIFFSACDSPQERQSKVKSYYDLKGFIETQIGVLNKQKPEVTKVMRVSSKNETRSSRDMEWKKELELFNQADINKPAYSKSYKIEKPDSSTVIYSVKTAESLPVRYLKIKVDKSTGNPVLIQALLRSENKLYQSEKNIELHGSTSGGQWKLIGYSIKGYQKLIFMEKKDFDVSAQVQ